MQQNVTADASSDIIAALNWYLDNGVDEAWEDAPVHAFEEVPSIAAPTISAATKKLNAQPAETQTLISLSELMQKAITAANAATSLDALREAITTFENGDLKQMATNLIFADGHPAADIMVITDVPTSDDDRQGKPLSGADGQLFDKAIRFIGRERLSDMSEKSIYIAPLLNWRPAGNRTPTDQEVSISLPFLERHIALVKPKIILVLGGIAAKALTGSNHGISRLRKNDYSYTTKTQKLTEKLDAVPMVVAYNMQYLRETPLQKKAFWSDLLKLNAMLSAAKQEKT